MAQHAILRFEKHKGNPARPLEAHHERQKEQYASNPDIDTSRSKYNFHIVKQMCIRDRSHIKRRVVNRSIARLFHRKNPPSKETTHAYNTFALWQLYHKRGRVINDGLSG